MKLNEVLAGVGTEPVASTKAKVEVTGLTTDSRRVKPGDLFIAVPGATADGTQFARAAVEQGAVAVLAEKPVPGLSVPLFLTASARKAAALAAGNFHGNPARELSLLGVTGTNGKTTTAWLLESIMTAGGSVCGLFGTIEVRFQGTRRAPTHTTPDPLELHRTFREMVDAGVDTVVMEVSSHALAQDRVHGLTFRAAGFTNLSRDHLDFHKDMEAYFQAKRRLFTDHLSPGGVAVVNGDDTYTTRIYNELRGQKRMAWKFSRLGNGEVSCGAAELTTAGIKATLKTPAGDIPVKSQLVGAHNLDNILTATGLALAAGASRRDVQDGIERVTRVPGRMEKVTGHGVTVLVDYAHTDDALARALDSARHVTKGRVLVVFGCGGDRDSGKRPLMGEAAAQADVPIVTSDNPRSEEPDDIIAQIVPGLEKAGLRRMSPAKARTGEKGYLVEADRRAAIATAISLAKENDTVLIAGKGHEAYQEQGGHKAPFDDLDEARKALG
ncbi:MAG: UDP-N-acetylmuramoyl-L-alanyl-D-glutamate--2,6-diaminopimelate ligase [Myxococcaceae bacterium]|nr:UDP-N-acetylmuramoyl-L-alanyl-D-glutamate--2,6-diaminopimelate ligase [Myxococcaceae bacterium]MCA3014277.1 UDP-N-acetylmuramoyl-L-alanyl-D-glutamate--2,6-diaminopimelate ligase [Myxococcaceae bacterium]